MLIKGYTQEAGVRQLQRKIEDVGPQGNQENTSPASAIFPYRSVPQVSALTSAILSITMNPMT